MQAMAMTWRERLNEWFGVAFFYGLFFISGGILAVAGAGTGEPVGILPGVALMVFPFFLLRRRR